MKLSNISTSSTNKKNSLPIQNDSYFIEIIKEKDKEIAQLKIELSNFPVRHPKDVIRLVIILLAVTLSGLLEVEAKSNVSTKILGKYLVI